jgi:Tfp pilus assembly protein PilX
MTPLTTDPGRRIVQSKEDRAVTKTRSSESGFALILAILALLLLTFLGLTIATSTSTELQIATNYRWGQQALYNAEAGLEAAKIILSSPPVASQAAGITTLPAVRTGPTQWNLGALSAPVEAPAAVRDFENGFVDAASPPVGCDRRGGGMGYGRVLTDGAQNYENVNTWAGQQLSGTFTIWVRRGLLANDNGTFSDSGDNSSAIVTVEGTAPYIDNTTAFTQANRAVRILETTLTLNSAQGINSCSGLEGQVGMSPQGDNFGCAMLDDSSVSALQ